MKLFSQTMCTLITATQHAGNRVLFQTAYLDCRIGLHWIVRCFTFPPTQYRLYGRLRTFR